MNLLELQRQVCQAVMQPLTPSEEMQLQLPDGTSTHALAEELIKPNDRLTSFERLEIYNRQYWFRILAAFNEDFPGLRAIIGNRRFDVLAEKYLSSNPSRSFTLRNLGSRLESWLRSNPGHLEPTTHSLALDMVRLEWAEIEAFDGREETPLTAEDLQGMGPDSPFRFQPYVQLLALSHPVDDLLISIRGEENPSDGAVASNAFTGRKKRRYLRSNRWAKPREIFLAVHRVDFSVYFKRMDREAFLSLQALRDGNTLSQAVEIGFSGNTASDQDRMALIQGWFQDWSRWGWLCSPDQATPIFSD